MVKGEKNSCNKMEKENLKSSLHTLDVLVCVLTVLIYIYTFDMFVGKECIYERSFNCVDNPKG